jgi:hypothetical protein
MSDVSAVAILTGSQAKPSPCDIFLRDIRWRGRSQAAGYKSGILGRGAVRTTRGAGAPGPTKGPAGGQEANPLTLRVLLGLKPIRAGETRNIVSDSSDFLGTHPSG